MLLPHVNKIVLIVCNFKEEVREIMDIIPDITETDAIEMLHNIKQCEEPKVFSLTF